MPDTFHLEIVTPEKMVVRDDAEEMQIPGKGGYLGILPGHAPLITELSAGELSYRNGGQTHRYAVVWGFAEVFPIKSPFSPKPPSVPKISMSSRARIKSSAPKSI